MIGRSALGDLPDGVFLDVLESDDAYRYVVDVPGASADDADVTAGRARLSIRAATSVRPAGHEIVASGRDDVLDVTVPLPPDAAADGDASARVAGGVLEVTLPRRGVGATTDVEVEGA